jgi:hypothetical protein
MDYVKFYNDVKTDIEMMVTDDMRAYAYADITHDLSFQIFRLLSGYEKALEELKKLPSSLFNNEIGE